MEYRNKYNVLLLSLFTIGGGLLVPIHFAKANPITGFVGDALISPVGWFIHFLANFFGAVLLPIAGALVNWSYSAGEFMNNPLVNEGWAISRDVANMFFILILLYIGLATILKLDNYGVKKLLPKFILIALLINFSLVIGGVFIDMGNDVGLFFTSAGAVNEKGEVVNVGDNIQAALAISNTFNIPKYNTIDPEGETASDDINILIRGVMNLIFVIIVAFLLFAMALIMIFRIIYLWVLLILAPFAWASYILPDTKKIWSGWWDNFLKWAFFPAIFGFFIYLALLTGLGFGESLFGNAPEISGELTKRGGEPFQNITLFLQYLTVLFILFFGLITSQKWGLAGAGMAKNWSDKAKNWSLGKMKTGGKYLAKSPRKAVKRTGEILERTPVGEKISEKEIAFRKKTEGLPVIGKMAGGPGHTYKKEQETLKEASKEVEKIKGDPTALRQKVNQTVTTRKGRAERVEALKLLAEKGKLEEGDKKHLPDVINSGADIKDILKSVPHWAMEKEVQKELASNPRISEKDQAAWKGLTGLSKDNREEREEIKKFIIENVMPSKPTEFAKTLSDNAFEDDVIQEIVVDRFADKRFTTAHINKSLEENSKRHGQLLTLLDENLDRMPKKLQEHLQGSPGHQAMRDREDTEDWQAESGTKEIDL